MEASGTVAEFHGRADALARAVAAAAQALGTAAFGSSHPLDSFLRIGNDRFVAVMPSSTEVDARLTETRATIEAEWLGCFEGAVDIAIAWVRTTTSELKNAATAARLEEGLTRRERTPALDALSGSNPFGPFASAPPVPGQREAFETKPLGVLVSRRLHRSVPGDDLVAVLASDLERVEWIRSRDDLASLASAAGDVAVGPISSVLALAATPFEFESAIAIEGARGERGLEGALARAVTAPSGRFHVFGVRAQRARFAEGFALGKDLAPLARCDESAMRGLLEVAIALDEGMDRAPLMLLSRWRARAHALAARLGMNERALRHVTDDASSERRALKTLIGEFPRWFDTGAARIPLYCALLEAGVATEASSA